MLNEFCFSCSFVLVLTVCVSRVIKEIFTSIDELIDNGKLTTELNMSALPNLYEQSVELIKHLVIHFEGEKKSSNK